MSRTRHLPVFRRNPVGHDRSRSAPDNVAMTTARIVILFALAAVDGVGYLERRIQSLEG